MFVENLPGYIKEVLIALLPIAAVFVIFQLLTRRYQKRQIKRIAIGLIYNYVGLVLFLCGVNVGFAPIGAFLGSELASVSFKWVLVPIGMLIGYYIVKAEPAVQVLNEQEEEITGGTISKQMMNLSLSLGVSLAVGISMIRVLTGISIFWIIIPGYVLSLLLSFFVPPIFVGVAFDSGGVASGPMTSTFLLPLSMGACMAIGGNVVTDAFGVVALVAMTPLIAIQLMGLIYSVKSRKHKAALYMLSDDIILEDD